MKTCTISTRTPLPMLLHQYRVAVACIACLALGALAVGAGVYHVDRDRATRAALERALYERNQLQAMVDLADKGGAMAVHLANVPASDLAYEIVAIPKFQPKGRE